jgi:transcriptional regulator with GAF, ATPase, and Fis domain
MNPITGLFLKDTPIYKGKLAAPNLKFDYPRKEGLTKRILHSKILALNILPEKYQSPKVKAEGIISVIGISLYTKRHDKPLAVMYLDYRKARKFSSVFINDLRLFAELASSELQSTWFIRRYREIAKIGQDINENFDNIQQMFESVFEHIKGILDVSFYFSLVSYDFRKDKVDLYLVDEGKRRIRQNYSLRRSSATAWVLRNLQVIASGDFRKGGLPAGVKVYHVAKTAAKEKSGIFVPIKIGDKPLGVLSVQHRKANYYDGEDRQILDLLANHIALALNNYRLLNDLRELDSSGQILTADLDPNTDIIEEVADRIFNATQADLITLYPYLQSEERYLSPLYRGRFFNPQVTLRVGEATPAAIVHKVSQQIEPIFAGKSPEFVY